MKIKITIEDLFNLTDSTIYNPDEFKPSSKISTDTRKIKKGSIFFALKGEKFDGHNFVEDAVNKGATTIVINKNKLKNFENVDCTIVAVKDTTSAYGELANIWRKKLNAKVIAITGSNGKTSTKEILATLLEEKFSVSKTLANNNNHIGVPLTIFDTNETNDVLVLELGTNHFGEIAYTAKIAQPDFAMVTNIGASHLEFLKDYEGVANEKLALIDETINRGGKIFLNTDNEILKKRSKNYKEKITFGFKGNPNYKGEITGYTEDAKTKIKITYAKGEFEVQLPIYGISNAKNFLAAAAIALEIGLTQNQIKKGAAKLTSVDKRLNVKKVKDFILINDTYNANPESMKSAFEFMNLFKGYKNKIAILGDMFELGEKGIEEHKKLAESIKKNKINEIYATGNLIENLISEISGNKILTKHFSRNDLQKFVSEKDFSKSVVLVKGSRGMKMEEFVKLIEEKA